MKVLRAVFLLILLSCAGTAGALWWWLTRDLPLASQAVELSIEAGTPPREIANAWVRAGVQTDPWLLYQWFRASGQARRIRAGSYQVEAGIMNVFPNAEVLIHEDPEGINEERAVFH